MQYQHFWRRWGGFHSSCIFFKTWVIISLYLQLTLYGWLVDTPNGLIGWCAELRGCELVCQGRTRRAETGMTHWSNFWRLSDKSKGIVMMRVLYMYKLLIDCFHNIILLEGITSLCCLLIGQHQLTSHGHLASKLVSSPGLPDSLLAKINAFALQRCRC